MKKKHPLRMGFDEVPFPQARPTRELLEEDAFMEAHGWESGYLGKALWTGGKTLLDMLLSVVVPRKPQAQASHSKPKRRHT